MRLATRGAQHIKIVTYRAFCLEVVDNLCNYVPAGHRDVPLTRLDPSSALLVGLMMPIRHGLFGRVS
jgi:hypothetical protein